MVGAPRDTREGGALERAQLMAGHKSARSTRLYSPALVQVSPAEIDRINL